MHSYRICGLSVASDIHLPGLIAGTAECEPQVTIRRGPVPIALAEPSMVGPTWQIAGQQFLLDVPNVARFLLNNGEQIVFAPESEASAEEVPIFIVGTVFGILLHQRQQIVLHASAVEVVGLLLGEMLPFYATIFILAWNGPFAVRAKDASSAAGHNDCLEP